MEFRGGGRGLLGYVFVPVPVRKSTGLWVTYAGTRAVNSQVSIYLKFIDFDLTI